MRALHVLTFSISIGWVAASCAPQDGGGTADATMRSTEAPAFDSVLARELGADDYGMRPYVMAFLKAGPNQDLDSAQAADLLRAHLDNIHRLAEDGRLVMAGPFMDTTAFAGIYIFNVESVDEARALTATDPAVQAGHFIMELHPWYGPAVLQQVVELNRKVERKSF